MTGREDRDQASSVTQSVSARSYRGERNLIIAHMFDTAAVLVVRRSMYPCADRGVGQVGLHQTPGRRRARAACWEGFHGDDRVKS